MNVVSFLQPLDRADMPDCVISSHQEILTLVSWKDISMESILSGVNSYIWTAMANGSERVVSEVGTGWDVESVKLGTVGGQAVQGLVGQLAAGGQVQRLNVAAVGGEAAEGRVANILQTRVMKDQTSTAWFNSTKCSFLQLCCTWQPLRLRLLRKPPHLFARFSTTVPSMSTWNSNKSTFCQLEPSRANTFQGLLT